MIILLSDFVAERVFTLVSLVKVTMFLAKVDTEPEALKGSEFSTSQLWKELPEVTSKPICEQEYA